MLNKLLNNGKYTKGIIDFEDYCTVYFLKGENCRNPNQAKVVNTMPRATKEELEWAYALTREKFLVRANKLSPIRATDWNRYLDVIFESILKDEAPIYEPKMNAYLEETVAKYLHPSDDFISLTEIARRFDAENPSYLIQSWLRGREIIIRNSMKRHFKNLWLTPKPHSLP